jgi:hypothetical protein
MTSIHCVRKNLKTQNSINPSFIFFSLPLIPTNRDPNFQNVLIFVIFAKMCAYRGAIFYFFFMIYIILSAKFGTIFGESRKFIKKNKYQPPTIERPLWPLKKGNGLIIGPQVLVKKKYVTLEKSSECLY